jgi:GNAT superfamily N-acetyltransferase
MLAALKSKVWHGASMENWVRRWPWEFVDHPFRPREIPADNCLAELDGKVVGGIGFIPTVLSFGGAQHESAYGCDLFIDPEAQGHGLGKSLVEQVLRRYPVSLWMNYDLAGARSYAKRRFTSVEPANFMALILDPGGVLRGRGRGGLGALAGWTRVPAQAWARFRSRGFRMPDGIRVEEITSFTEEFDSLDEAQRDPLFVKPVRNAAYLRWRYLACPFGPFRILAARRGGELAGFVVHRTHSGHRGRVGTILEIEALADVPKLTEGLVASAVRNLLEERVDYIRAFPLDTETRRAFGRLGFVDSRRTPYIYVSPGAAEKLGLPADGARWRMSLGDCDLDFS